jgi:hypothetical protein
LRSTLLNVVCRLQLLGGPPRKAHLVRPAELFDLPLELSQAGPLVGRDHGPAALVDLGAAYPHPQRLPVDVELRRDRLDRLPLRRMLMGVLEHHPHRPLTQLGRIPPASSNS